MINTDTTATGVSSQSNLHAHLDTIISMGNIELYTFVNEVMEGEQSFSMMADFEYMVYYLKSNYGATDYKDLYRILDEESLKGIEATIKMIVELASNWADAYACDDFVNDGKGQAINEAIDTFVGDYINN